MKPSFIVQSLLLCILAAALLGGPLPARAEESFVIGVAPHSSTRIILDMYQPLRRFLELQLGRPVEIITAPDFDIYARRALAQQYDLAITTGHQARLLQTDAGYRPLLTYRAPFKAVALVAADGPIHGDADLHGRKVLGLSPTSLVTMWGERWLAERGISMAPMIYVSAADSVARQVIAGEAALGLTSLTNYLNLSDELRSRLVIHAESPPLAGRIYLLNGRHAARAAAIEQALWDFAVTPEAREYFARYRLDGYRKLGADELRALDNYAAGVRRQLQGTAP